MSYYASDKLSSIGDFLNNNKSPALGKLVESAAKLRGAENISNFENIGKATKSALYRDMREELGEIEGKAYDKIASNQKQSDIFNTVGDFGRVLIGSGALGNPFDGGGSMPTTTGFTDVPNTGSGFYYAPDGSIQVNPT